MNSNQKGKRGEREWRDVLRAAGFDARRGQQFAGGTDSPDVICPALAGFHFEVKRVEKLNIENAVAQAVEDAGTKTPTVAHKRNRGDWFVTMRADDWLKLVGLLVLPSVHIDAEAALKETEAWNAYAEAGQIHYWTGPGLTESEAKTMFEQWLKNRNAGR